MYIEKNGYFLVLGKTLWVSFCVVVGIKGLSDEGRRCGKKLNRHILRQVGV